MSTTQQRIARTNFSTGSVSLYVNTADSKEREIEGRVTLKLAYPSFVRGVWIKLVGLNSIASENFGVLSHDLFIGEEDHHKDGLHQVLIGFGEGDYSNGSYLEMNPGRYCWPFHFKLPHQAPASYFDGKINISYKLIATLDSPTVQTVNSKIFLQYDWIVHNYSHFNFLRLKEAQVLGNRELLQKGAIITSTKDRNQQVGGLLPGLLSMIRSPVVLNIRGNPTQHSGALNGVGPSASHCAIFPFLTRLHNYEILCSLGEFFKFFVWF